MSQFKEIFEAYGGNYDSTLGRFLGNESMYLRLLKMFFQDENMGLLGGGYRKSGVESCF